MAELEPSVMPVKPKRSRALMVVGVIFGSFVALYLFLVLFGGMTWDGY
jgi:hypothetical protein